MYFAPSDWTCGCLLITTVNDHLVNKLQNDVILLIFEV